MKTTTILKEDTMFPETQKEKGVGMKAGSDKNLSDINKYIKFALNNIGFECTAILGEVNVRNHKPLAAYKDWSDGSKKNLVGGGSNRQLIFSSSDTKKTLTAQCIIVDDLHSVDTRANSNIPADVVDHTTEEERVSVWLESLRAENVYLFLYVKQGSRYVLIKYSDIPAEHYQLTYRAKKTRKNRMWIPAEYLPKFRNIIHLENDLKTILKIK